jgi:SAM-dependent methyltransferase
MKRNDNPWREIPLTDYEQHMSHASVGQLMLLNSLTKKYLSCIKPKTSVFLGIAGGNGLEHVDTNITKSVIGIDINQSYLDITYKRYGAKIDSLLLLNLDITQNVDPLISSDFVWAALLLEYTGIDHSLQFSKKILMPGGHFIVTIQLNNGLQSVSSTGIESVKKAGTLFKTVDPEILLAKATEMGFTLNGKEENILPNEKSFVTFDFIN